MTAPTPHTITTCLWFDGHAEEAAKLYTSVFKNSKITGNYSYGGTGDAAKAVTFVLDGVPFVAMDGGDHLKFSPSVSFQVPCETQADIDYYWDKLSEGADESKSQSGWLTDRFGVTWQILPNKLEEIMNSSDQDKIAKVSEAILQMRKINLDALVKL